jgi:hypothetical protein
MPGQEDAVSASFQCRADIVQVFGERKDEVNVVCPVLNGFPDDCDHRFTWFIVQIFRSQPDDANVEIGSAQRSKHHLDLDQSTFLKNCPV